MSDIEKQTEITKKLGLKRCSMGRCCNVERLAAAEKVAKFYATLTIKDYPNMGDVARRYFKEKDV